MDLISEHGIQLGFGLLGTLAIFIAAYALPERWTVVILLLVLPFQLISSRYGTINVGMAYLAFMAFVFQGRIRHLPYLSLAALILFAYLMSMALSLPETYPRQALYLINVMGNFVLFYFVYNHFRRQPDARFALSVLLWMNAVVLLFTMLQLTLGFERLNVLGIAEWSVGGNIEEKRRLLGPFGTAGVNGSYFMLQILLLGYVFMYSRGLFSRSVVAALALGNFAMLVGTGSRGGFLALLFGSLLFLIMFRQRLGTLRLVGLLAGGSAGMALAALVMITYTPFDTLFTRLADTEFTGLVPDTRQGWLYTIERIPEAIVFGHGPVIEYGEMSQRFMREVFIGYPHNLYLFLLYSLGAVGFLAWMAWFATLLLHWLGIARRETEIGLAADLPRLGVVLLLTFLFDQMKIEFLRFQVLDFQQYVFATWGIFSAFAITAAQRLRKPVAARSGVSGPAPLPAGPLPAAPLLPRSGAPGPARG